MSATTAVFDTTELLEAILIHLSELSIGDLWRAQHISKRALEVIRESRTLSTRRYAAIRPGRTIPPPGACLEVFDDVDFDCRFASQREGHHWRRKLDLPRRSIDKPEGKIPGLITKCLNAASVVRTRSEKETLTIRLDRKSDVYNRKWNQLWRDHPKLRVSLAPLNNHLPTEYEKLHVAYNQVVKSRGTSIEDGVLEARAWAEIPVPKGCTMLDLLQLVEHLVFAHPFTGEDPSWMKPGTAKDPMVIRWRWKGYSRAMRGAKRTVSARAFMLGEPTYGVEISAREDRLWTKIRGAVAVKNWI